MQHDKNQFDPNEIVKEVFISHKILCKAILMSGSVMTETRQGRSEYGRRDLQ